MRDLEKDLGHCEKVITLSAFFDDKKAKCTLDAFDSIVCELKFQQEKNIVAEAKIKQLENQLKTLTQKAEMLIDDEQFRTESAKFDFDFVIEQYKKLKIRNSELEAAMAIMAEKENINFCPMEFHSEEIFDYCTSKYRGAPCRGEVECWIELARRKYSDDFTSEKTVEKITDVHCPAAGDSDFDCCPVYEQLTQKRKELEAEYERLIQTNNKLLGGGNLD